MDLLKLFSVRTDSSLKSLHLKSLHHTQTVLNQKNRKKRDMAGKNIKFDGLPCNLAQTVVTR